MRARVVISPTQSRKYADFVDPFRSEGTLDITRDMTRQYKGMQEELLNRINQLEGTIQVRTSKWKCIRGKLSERVHEGREQAEDTP